MRRTCGRRACGRPAAVAKRASRAACRIRGRTSRWEASVAPHCAQNPPPSFSPHSRQNLEPAGTCALHFGQERATCGRGGTRSLRLRLGCGLRLAGDGLRVLLGVAVAVALAVRAAERAHEAAELAHESLRLIVAAALVGAVLFATAHGEEPHRVVLSIQVGSCAPGYRMRSGSAASAADSRKKPRGTASLAPSPSPSSNSQCNRVSVNDSRACEFAHANQFFRLRAIWRFEASLDTDPRKWFLRFRRSRDSCSIAAGQHVP